MLVTIFLSVCAEIPGRSRRLCHVFSCWCDRSAHCRGMTAGASQSLHVLNYNYYYYLMLCSVS